jgi:hypothetical protein
MIRLLDINGHATVAGLSWDSLAGSTIKGIDARERAIDFDAVAYLRGPDPKSTKKRPPVKYLAAGYAGSEKMLESSDALEQSDILKKPSLCLWVIESLERHGIGVDEDGKVNGVFRLDLENGEFWIGAVRQSRPAPFEDSDWIGKGDALRTTVASLIEESESLIDDAEIVDISASELLDAKPSRSAGVMVKGRGGGAATAFQLLIVAVLLGGIGFFIYNVFFAEEEQRMRVGPTPEEQRMKAMNSYQAAMQEDFGYKSAKQAYEVVLGNAQSVPTSVETWSFIGVSCRAEMSECLYKFESPGYGTPSVIENAFSQPLEINLTGREALYRKQVDFKKEVGRNFRVPSSESVRKPLLDAAAFLRSPALELTVDISAPEDVAIDNGSFLSSTSFSAEYKKGGISVSGPLGLMDIAANELDINGIVITEIIINLKEFSMRGHYAFE